MKVGGIYINSVGVKLGEMSIDNGAVAATYGKDNEFAASRIGALQLRRAGPDETAVSMAAAACHKAFDGFNGALEDIELLLFVTQNPDYGGLPHNSAILQAELGLPTGIACLDIGLGCSGYVYALAVASSMMKALCIQTALVVTSDQYGKHLADNDASTQMLFGDGASATILSTVEGALEIKACRLGTDGASHNALARRNGVIQMNGRAVFGFSRKVVPREILAFVDDAGISLESVQALLLHQGSRAIIQEIQLALGLDEKVVPIEMEGYGNLVSSSIPALLKSRLEDRSLSRIVLAGFGVGLSWGTLWLERNVKYD